MITLALAILVANRKDLRTNTSMFMVCALLDTLCVWMVAKALGGW